ncbi:MULTISPECIES: hypothetical protein [Burkholderia]|uniref:hypothetical protein n=1 Tax=Burkholderia TaxID=32008 RepID=UPI00126A02BC|nr:MULTISPECIES: hypothetical protein [Burkholderia]
MQPSRRVARYRQASRRAAFFVGHRRRPMLRRIASGHGGRCLPRGTAAVWMERTLETHAATAHESACRRDFVCALCGVFFVIRNPTTELHREKQQLHT